MGFCWNNDSRRVRVLSKLNHCIMTKLKKSAQDVRKHPPGRFEKSKLTNRLRLGRKLSDHIGVHIIAAIF